MKESTKDSILISIFVFLIIIVGGLFIANLNKIISSYDQQTTVENSSKRFSFDVLKESILNEKISLEDYFLINEIVKRHTDVLVTKNVDVIDCRGDSQKRKWEILEEYHGCWYSGSGDPDDDNNGCYFIQEGEIFPAHDMSQLEEKLPGYMVMVSKETFWPLKSNLDITEDGLSVHIMRF